MMAEQGGMKNGGRRIKTDHLFIAVHDFNMSSTVIIRLLKSFDKNYYTVHSALCLSHFCSATHSLFQMLMHH